MLNVDALLAVMEAVKENGIAELKITNDAVEIRTVIAAPLAAQPVAVAQAPVAEVVPVAPSEKQTAPTNLAKEAAPAPAAASTDGIKVEAPIPGTIFVSPGKDMDGNALPAVGSKVKKNQVVALLEAMKMFNEIFAPVSGTIVSINATNESPINPGDLIMVIQED
jgi:biotin carboxyl carrier protein